MKLLKQFSNNQIRVFAVIDETVYALTEQQQLCIYNENESKVIDFGSSCMYKYGKNLFSGRNFYYDSQKQEIIEINELTGCYFTNTAYNNLYLFNNNNNELLLYDWNSKKIIHNNILPGQNGLLKIIDGDKGLCYGREFLSCRSLLNNNELWKYDIEEHFGSKEFYISGAGDVIIYGKSAFFSLKKVFGSKSPTPEATVQIDLETGKEINRYNDFLFPVLSGNRLITAGYKAMVILNLDDNKIITKDYSQYMAPENLDFGDYYVSGNDFYFKASDIRMNSYIGIINIETEEFALQALNKNKKTYKLAAREIKLCNNKLYVLGSNRVLYVYEK